jgi:hypothetical protein
MMIHGPGSNENEQSYWMRAIKLNARPLDEGSRPARSGKSRLILYGTILGGKSIG